MELSRAYLLIVKRKTFSLEVWYRGPFKTKYRLAEKHTIAVGAKGYDTPVGVYFIQAKARNPDWLMPNSKWVAPEDRGKIIPGGDPRNPIIGSFLKLTDDGVGIHGTRSLESLGSAASHGCIRVHPDVAVSLHRRIPTGTPVVIL